MHDLKLFFFLHFFSSPHRGVSLVIQLSRDNQLSEREKYSTVLIKIQI